MKRKLKLMVIPIFFLAVAVIGCDSGGGGSSSDGGSTPAATYTVTYDGNGATSGSVPTDATKYLTDQVVTVPDNPGNIDKANYDFAGWNTAPDGSGTTYVQGQTFKMGSANVTLYAKWTAVPTYTVTYDGNGNTGGNVPTDSTNYEETQTVTVIGNTGNLVKTNPPFGFTFAGWNTRADGSGTTYNTPGATFQMGTSNVILYAVWTPNPTYFVTYDGNGNTGGSVPTDSMNYEQGFTVTVPGNPGNLVKTHFSFAGWNTAIDGSGTTYTTGNTFTMGSDDVVLYAMWTPLPTYTVTYNGNGNTGGIVPVDSGNYEQGVLVTVLGNTGALVRARYDFAGWNTQADGLGTTYTAGNTFPMGSANVILYAKWTAKPTYTVTYNGNGSTGGSVPIDATNYIQGDTVTVAGNTGNLVKPLYTFSGWNTQADGLGTNYTQGETFTMGSANVTLYAKWSLGPLSSDANTVLLDHFDGSLVSPGAIYGYEGPTQTCVGETFIVGALAPVFVAGQSGFGQALSLSPPAGFPNGASFLEYYNAAGTYAEPLSRPNGTLEFWVFLSGYGASGLDLADQMEYYSICTNLAFRMRVSAMGQLSASFNNDAWSMNSGAVAVPLSTWTHVAASWGSAGSKLYINGVQVGSNPSTGYPLPSTGFRGELSMRLGTETGVTTRMDELRISNIQRTW